MTCIGDIPAVPLTPFRSSGFTRLAGTPICFFLTSACAISIPESASTSDTLIAPLDTPLSVPTGKNPASPPKSTTLKTAATGNGANRCAFETGESAPNGWGSEEILSKIATQKLGLVDESKYSSNVPFNRKPSLWRARNKRAFMAVTRCPQEFPNLLKRESAEVVHQYDQSLRFR